MPKPQNVLLVALQRAASLTGPTKLSRRSTRKGRTKRRRNTMRMITVPMFKLRAWTQFREKSRMVPIPNRGSALYVLGFRLAPCVETCCRRFTHSIPSVSGLDAAQHIRSWRFWPFMQRIYMPCIRSALGLDDYIGELGNAIGWSRPSLFSGLCFVILDCKHIHVVNGQRPNSTDIYWTGQECSSRRPFLILLSFIKINYRRLIVVNLLPLVLLWVDIDKVELVRPHAQFNISRVVVLRPT